MRCHLHVQAISEISWRLVITAWLTGTTKQLDFGADIEQESSHGANYAYVEGEGGWLDIDQSGYAGTVLEGF